MNHKGTQTLQTQRLILRPFAYADAASMFNNWASDPIVTQFLTWPPHANLEVTQHIVTDWMANYDFPDTYQWAITLIHNPAEVFGSIGVVNQDELKQEAEIGYVLSRQLWNQGYITEAFEEVLRYLFEVVGFNRVEALHDVANAASGRVMQKVGLRFEGISRQGGFNNRGIVDQATYATIKADLERSE